VERRNRTLVEAARTMLIFSRAPLFLWAEAIATAKPDLLFLYVFGALCYPKNDREDIGKLGAKGDIGFFIGYSADSCAYRIYNRRTKKIMETMNVSFDELLTMAFEQRSSKPGVQCMTSGQISSGLDLTYAPSTITTQQPTEGELDLLFEAMYDDYFGGQPSANVENVPPVQEPNADHTRLISKSIFVTNFPDNTSSKDLWKLCQDYGTVVDVYIPNRKSKAGKRFALVRFIKVENIDRPVGNLCTLWIGRMHLHANVVRFERSPIEASRSASSARPNHIGASSFATVLKGNNKPVNASEAPAMVIDDLCVVTRDLEFFVMGEVKKFSSIPNLRVLLFNEGFRNVKVVYLGGLWVMFELESLKSKAKFMQHGVPLHDWSRATFTKIGSKWDEVMDLEESKDDFFARKRIYIKTKQEDNILEKFKIIVKGKNFVIRAKELFAWSPVFNEVKEVEYCTDDESVQGTNEDKGEVSNKVQPNPESDDEGVFDTYCDESEENLGNEHNSEQPMNDKEKSQDPFNFYDLLKKRDGGVDILGSDISIPYPPGFTFEKLNNNADVHEVKDMNTEPSECRSEGLCSCVLEELQHTYDLLSSGVRSNGHMPKKGGFVLEVLDEMIKVGQTMGYTMEGCDSIVMGDFNEVRSADEHMGSVFNIQGAADFNDFISNSGLVDIQLEDDVDINTLTLEQYQAWVQDDIRPGMVKPKIGNDVELEFNSNFMRELRRKLFKGTDDEDAHEHVRRVLEITNLFYFLDVTHDAIMLRVFPISLKEPGLRWINRLSAGLVTTWDLLEKAFIRQYFPPFKTANKLEIIRNFKQDMDETLYHTWERERINDRLDNIDAIQASFKEAHLTKECPLKKDKEVEQSKYVGSLEETIIKFCEESIKSQVAKTVLTNTSEKDKTRTTKGKENVEELVPRDLPVVQTYVPYTSFLGHLKDKWAALTELAKLFA
nr:RNA-directed DNA polymerase, eukaryota, nucleotide-binding alpha-beta plait domain protein [Tanacetum cinerariifolium]